MLQSEPLKTAPQLLLLLEAHKAVLDRGLGKVQEGHLIQFEGGGSDGILPRQAGQEHPAVVGAKNHGMPCSQQKLLNPYPATEAS